MSGMTVFTSTGLSHDFLAQSIFLSQELLNDIIIQINDTRSFNEDGEYYWNQQLSSLTSDISQFVEITTLISRVMVDKKHKVFADIKNSHVHLLFIMKGMNQAQQKNDFVALEELIKYELRDNLTLWKIDLIPQTKRLLNP